MKTDNYIADAQFFLSEILISYTNSQTESYSKIFELKDILNSAVKRFTADEQSFFSGNYSRLIFLIDKHDIDQQLSSDLRRLRYFAKNLIPDADINLKTLNYFVKAVSRLIIEISGEYPKFFEDFLEKLETEAPRTEEKSDSEEHSLVTLIVIAKGDRTEYRGEQYSNLKCCNDIGEELNLQLTGRWNELYKMIWTGAKLSATDVIIKNKKDIITKQSSLLILEPDYLFDVTEIAECFTGNTVQPLNYFLKKFSSRKTSMPLVLGNVINSCFDELITNGIRDFESTYQKALQSRPLQLFSIATDNMQSARNLKIKAKEHYDNLSKIIPQINFGTPSIEPSFISPIYGLQGRLDLLIEYRDDNLKKDVYELKSGKAPSIQYSMKSTEQRLERGLWPNHFAQVICYNMLMDSSFEDRYGVSSIIYSRDGQNPIRNAPNINAKRKEIIRCRNQILAVERSVRLGYYQLFAQINPAKFCDAPYYTADQVSEFHSIYSSLDSIEKEYFHYFSSFITNEMFSEKTGGEDEYRTASQSSLWSETLWSKQQLLLVMTDLKLNIEKSSLEHSYLSFDREGKDNSNFRQGDIVLIYPQASEYSAKPWQQQLIKGHIKELSKDSVLVSLRNKLFDNRKFDEYDTWVIEHDYMDHTTKRTFLSLFEFIQSESPKKKMLLGTEEPHIGSEMSITPDQLSSYHELSSTKQKLMQSIIKSEDYFLLQGPPGTGKTSYMLRCIAEYFYQLEEDIIVVAYTNRAVDEICSSLKRIPGMNFLRLGGKESSEHTDVLISKLAEVMPLKELYIKIRDTRVFAATSSSLLTNPEIMEIKNFRYAIIDESSQIQETHLIGLLTSVEKFVMIGDEKQLPFIVSQSSEKLKSIIEKKIDFEMLSSIHIGAESLSLFERLLRCCITNHWDHAYGMLNQQGRMHKEIADYPNKHFYDNKLDVLEENGWQTGAIECFKTDSADKIESALSVSRLLFIDSKPEMRSKINLLEAELCTKIIGTIHKVYGERFDNKTVGVITPFRAQCSEILNRLPAAISEKVSVDTVERFQGSERDIIILSFAINNEYYLPKIQSLSTLGQITVDRKLNVAITRARKHLVVLGNSSILMKNPQFSSFIEYFRQEGAFLDSTIFEMNFE